MGFYTSLCVCVFLNIQNPLLDGVRELMGSIASHSIHVKTQLTLIGDTHWHAKPLFAVAAFRRCEAAYYCEMVL